MDAIIRREQRAGVAQNHDDQPDERTSLLRHERRPRYETASRRESRVEEYSSSKGTITTTSSSSSASSSTSSHTAQEDEDPEANGHGNGTATAQAHDASRPKSFLIDTHPRRFRVVFGGIMLTYFLANVDGTIMASSHPVITSHFGASNMASWLTTAFMLTSTAFQPLVGRLSDTIGRKPLYLATMAAFSLATVWCALAQSIGSFIAARAVCGLGAGGMMTLGAISISDCIPIERRGPYQGVINVVYGVASASGAAFGGLLADSLGWRWEFGVQLVPLALCLAIAALGMPADLGLQEGREKQTLMQALRGFDFKGSALVTASTTSLILGLNLGGNVLPWSHPFIITSLAVFVVCFSTCIYVEGRVERPIMPLALLHSTPRANIIFANAIASFLLNAILFNVPLFFRAVLLKTATESGLYLVLPTAVASVAGTVTSILISRLGRLKWPLLSGAVLFVAGTGVLAAMAPGWPTWAYLLCLVPFALAQGAQFPGTSMALLAASAHGDQAVAQSTLQLWRSLGNVLGVACSSLVFQNSLLRFLVRYVSVPADADAGGDGGEEWKRHLIERVRSSIESISNLPDGPTKDQVVMSYAAACRTTFLVCFGFAFVSVFLLLPIKLPRLSRK